MRVWTVLEYQNGTFKCQWLCRVINKQLRQVRITEISFKIMIVIIIIEVCADFQLIVFRF